MLCTWPALGSLPLRRRDRVSESSQPKSSHRPESPWASCGACARPPDRTADPASGYDDASATDWASPHACPSWLSFPFCASSPSSPCPPPPDGPRRSPWFPHRGCGDDGTTEAAEEVAWAPPPLPAHCGEVQSHWHVDAHSAAHNSLAPPSCGRLFLPPRASCGHRAGSTARSSSSGCATGAGHTRWGESVDASKTGT